MGAVQLGWFFPLRRGRHESVPGSAVSTGIGPLDSPIIDALSRWRGRLGETRWFELFSMMIAPLGLFAVLAGSSGDVVTRSFLICFAIYSDLLIALLWITEKNDARTEPTQSHPRLKRMALCVKGQGDDHPQFPQPMDIRETHSQRRGRPQAMGLRLGFGTAGGIRNADAA
jgi:hypothetical protein